MLNKCSKNKTCEQLNNNKVDSPSIAAINRLHQTRKSQHFPLGTPPFHINSQQKRTLYIDNDKKINTFHHETPHRRETSKHNLSTAAKSLPRLLHP